VSRKYVHKIARTLEGLNQHQRSSPKQEVR
jgi:hypothetical protein